MKRLFLFCAVFLCLVAGVVLPVSIAQADGPIIGEVRIFAGPAAKVPGGWWVADGSCFDTTDYPELYDVIGDIYDDGVSCSGDERQLPALTGRFPVGCVSDGCVGTEGGESQHTLTLEEIPSHQHQLNYSSLTYIAPGSSYGIAGASGQVYGTTTYVGGGQAHNNMPPYIGFYFIIAYTTTVSITPTPTPTLTPTSTPIITGTTYLPYLSAYTQTLSSGNELVVPVYLDFGHIFITGTGFLIIASFCLMVLVRMTR